MQPSEREAHGPRDLSADHVPHVLPIAHYFKVWGALLVLTAVTVGASYVDLGAANIGIALLIATTKALLVAAIFMHLRYDQSFHSVIIASSLIFLVLFIGFTMFDTEARGMGDRVRSDRPLDIKNPFSGSRSEQEMRDKYSPKP